MKSGARGRSEEVVVAPSDEVEVVSVSDVPGLSMTVVPEAIVLLVEGASSSSVTGLSAATPPHAARSKTSIRDRSTPNNLDASVFSSGKSSDT